jgi:hypothetical protein
MGMNSDSNVGLPDPLHGMILPDGERRAPQGDRGSPFAANRKEHAMSYHSLSISLRYSG